MDQDLWIGAVRHGESTANVAATAAARDGLDLIEIAEREADVPLSDLGRQQAGSLARGLQSLPASERPDLVISSPFLRARQTAEIATQGLDVRLRVDERPRAVLREIEQDVPSRRVLLVAHDVVEAAEAHPTAEEPVA